MSRFVYLIQGKADLLSAYKALVERGDIDTLRLTYDKEIPGAFFLPRSTWAEGRNFLLEKAQETGCDYRYYIFLDDDISFQHGSFLEFEHYLNRYRPAAAVPVFVPKTLSTVIGLGLSASRQLANSLPAQICRLADAQFLALHRDVIADRLAVPLRVEFDPISWWYTSSTQQLVLQNIYPRHFLQFNRIRVSNDYHGEYTNNSFKDAQRQWLLSQFQTGYKDPRPFANSMLLRSTLTNLLTGGDFREVVRAFVTFVSTLFGSLTYSPRERYRMPEERVRRVLSRASSLLKQYEELPRSR